MSDPLGHTADMDTRERQVSAVATTGIYCRPECAARPNPENVAGYISPVAAEAAGYRSCLRCRPDRHLAVAPAIGVPPAVARALSLISDGYLDRFDEQALADRVGYSTRQLRRLFEQHVGATPAFVGRSRRAHFARRLLDETDLPMPVVAGAAGFGSVRQMNRVVAGIFRFSPTVLRAKRRGGDVLVADGGLRLRLPFMEPLDRQAALDHLEPRVTPGVEAVVGSVYRRTLEVCGNPGVIEVALAGTEPHLELTAHLPTFDSIIDDVARVRSMFGLDDDVAAAESRLGSDPLLGPLVRRRPGLRVIGGWDRFEVAVRVIVGQQISVAGATTITARIVERHGRALPGSALGLDRLFPTPDALLALDPAGLGMPERRVATIRALAAAVLDGSVDLRAEPETVRAGLLGLAGIGPWTADVIMMRATRDPDAFPASDLGIRHAMSALLGRDDPPSADEIEDLAEAWRPHRALAAQHLWSGLRTESTQERQ
jgi:AraC family transcriptional regulator, regulatory protein of adaptative response / DNA-3-methyladenine glycosylase II